MNETSVRPPFRPEHWRWQEIADHAVYSSEVPAFRSSVENEADAQARAEAILAVEIRERYDGLSTIPAVESLESINSYTLWNEHMQQ